MTVALIGPYGFASSTASAVSYLFPVVVVDPPEHQEGIRGFLRTISMQILANLPLEAIIVVSSTRTALPTEFPTLIKRSSLKNSSGSSRSLAHTKVKATSSTEGRRFGRHLLIVKTSEKSRCSQPLLVVSSTIGMALPLIGGSFVPLPSRLRRLFVFLTLRPNWSHSSVEGERWWNPHGSSNPTFGLNQHSVRERDTAKAKRFKHEIINFAGNIIGPLQAIYSVIGFFKRLEVGLIWAYLYTMTTKEKTIKYEGLDDKFGRPLEGLDVRT
ncbi:hypothetical protein M9H77_04480 [Catharanthus roseus]|uniref:Uncharacterized protein n=1 Tax=Catharanthus roseus TaxID=4058 RepID=A0ACC0CEF1_CATRO|nr:hypothetical protein M9H77_04480 [Catharanthus roseus]